ncbi:hypothetical protein KVT40_006851 [Elsinoe batatas]|uniref:Uncharacterized protein n=1 Tax=Elsinoe batatas TaxID=2601811 RepID=A0A8K0KXI8_9PEZI|nr:hypothetical protein KVT40_006851 [Elsinoe batatas]
MGWLWNSKPSDDGYDILDAKTKALLDKEAPKPQSSPPPAIASQTAQPPPKSYSERVGLTNPLDKPTSPSSSESDTSLTVPPQSLYQDGRYSHLWKTYTPSTSAPSPTASQDQLTNLLSSYSSRRAAVSRAALENCVEEHIAENECFSSGNLAQKMRGCRDESKTFSKCYTLQARFLKAMGYMDLRLDEDGRGDERREAMQARADGIWQEVRRREELEKMAKKEGREMPVFGELEVPWRGEVGSGKSSEERQEEMLAWFKEERRELVREELKKVPEGERELELRLRIAETKADVGYGEAVGRFFEQEKEDRRARKEKGNTTLGDWLKWMGGWSQ